MKILILLHGNYGERIAENLSARSPEDWQIRRLQLPKALPVNEELEKALMSAAGKYQD